MTSAKTALAGFDTDPGPPLGDEPARAAARPADPLVRALVRYVEALHHRYPDGPEQMRRERLDGRATMPPMRLVTRDPAA